MNIVTSSAAALPFATSEHQRKVDAIQAEIRSEVGAPRPPLFKAAAGEAARASWFKPPVLRPALSESALDHHLSEELIYLSRQLEQLGGLLANDPILLVRHAAQLQAIDLMKQSLGHLAAVVAAEDKGAAVARISLTELKGRLQRERVRPIGGQD